MDRNARFFSDVTTPRVYRDTGAQGGVYTQYSEYSAPVVPGPMINAPPVVGGPAGGPWWAQGVSQSRTYQTGGDLRLINNSQMSPEDRMAYERYLTTERPFDVIVSDDRERQSNGRKRKLDYSGMWRQIGDPYVYSDQPQTAYVDPRPAPRAFVTEDVGYSPYGYQEVVAPPRQVSREVIRPVPVGRPVFSNTRVY